jgi:NAD(P)-dependent dehydrogenase (short-subunit alcohol dehydrogenase family)
MKISPGMSAVITGGGSGVGLSIVRTLAARGVNVAIADIDESAAKAAAHEVAVPGIRAAAYQVDVSDLHQVECMADTAWGTFGGIDILVNNAGVTLRPFRASWDTSVEDFRWVMNVNWGGVMNGHLAFVGRMIDRGLPGHIVNTSSMASLMTIPGHSAYSASKAAVDAFSLCARDELSPRRIGVSLLHPARVQTRISTSERVRPAAEQSANRTLQPWVDELHPPSRSQVKDTGTSGDESLPATASDPFEAISPSRIGDLVVRGIELNLPHILTHPAPVDKLRTRVEQVIDGAGLWER